jgi:Zn-dependent protease
LKCQQCGKEEPLPFKCQNCQGLFCAEHRLPENHNCPEIWRAKLPREQGPAPYEFKVTVQPPRPSTKLGFSKIEARDLVISALLVSGVGLSIAPADALHLLGSQPEVVITLMLVFTASFLVHEIVHKLTAQRYGLWAEFRLILWGALITLISIISPFFKIISPGAVMIAGVADKEIVGKTAISGPLTNMVICVVSFALTFIIPSTSPFFDVVLLSATFNAFIAVLNLIPFGMFDGWKVFQWSKLAWAIVFISSIVIAFEIFAFYSIRWF